MEDISAFAVAGGAADELDIVDLVIRVGQIQPVSDEPAQGSADLGVVKSDVAADRVEGDGIVIGDDSAAGSSGLLQNGILFLSPVDKGNDKGLRVVGDHVFDLGRLRGRIVAGKLEVDFVAELLQLPAHVNAVPPPALDLLRRHGNAHQIVPAHRLRLRLGIRRRLKRGFGGGGFGHGLLRLRCSGLCGAGRQHEKQRQGQQYGQDAV